MIQALRKGVCKLGEYWVTWEDAEGLLEQRDGHMGARRGKMGM